MKSYLNILFWQKCIIFLLILGFFVIPFGQAFQETSNEKTLILEEVIHLSPLTLNQVNDKIALFLPESNSFTMIPGDLKIPTIQKIYEFPINTEIININVIPKETTSTVIDGPVELVPLFHEINGRKTLGIVRKLSDYDTRIYPPAPFSYHTGVGLNNENIRVLFLSLTINPIQYHASENILSCADYVDVEIEYVLPDPSLHSSNIVGSNDLLIITHDSYEFDLDQFIEHKQNHGLTVHVETLDDIYRTYSGRDNAEKIKYCVKHAIEEWNTLYVLIIGDIKQVPMRTSDAYPWSDYHGAGILTDMYYADVYDSSMMFCSWDANKNNVFGEVVFDGFPPLAEDDLDDVDLYADVHIGRIPCSTIDELNIVLNKIMTYETITYDQIWFQNILLAGGDTFGLSLFSPPFVYEGEITNTKVGQQLPEFNQIKLWASQRNLHAWTFNREISKGVGFVSYAGHGFEHGWGTYHPNAVLDGNLIFYFTPYLKFLKNENMLPIIFFDACLTAKLDFNISDLIDYFGLKARFVNFLFGSYTSQDYFDVFAWAFLKLESGGCVANIGATRPAYTYVDKDGVYAGAGYLDVHFFKAYEEGVKVGEMLTSAQRDYANYVGKDFFTIEEYILLGDPSLRVGGYP